MNADFVLLSMFFCHIVDDYYLQGILANMKQRSWWIKNAPDELYKFDYVLALFIHGFSWAFMIMLPLAIYTGFEGNMLFTVLVLGNAIVHAAVDHLKANVRAINLWLDQLIHFGQILATFTLYLEAIL